MRKQVSIILKQHRVHSRAELIQLLRPQEIVEPRRDEATELKKAA